MKSFIQFSFYAVIWIYEVRNADKPIEIWAKRFKIIFPFSRIPWFVIKLELDFIFKTIQHGQGKVIDFRSKASVCQRKDKDPVIWLIGWPIGIIKVHRVGLIDLGTHKNLGLLRLIQDTSLARKTIQFSHSIIFLHCKPKDNHWSTI